MKNNGFSQSNTIKYILKLTGLGLFIFLWSGCGGRTVQSTWTAKDIQIDGRSDDWDSAWLQFDDDLKMLYGVVNSDDKIDVLIEFKDPVLAQRICTQGFTIWFDKDKTRGVQYIDYSAMDQMIDRLMSGPASGQEPRMRPSGDDYTKWLNGSFYLIENGLPYEIGKDGKKGIRADASEEDHMYTLEYQFSYAGQAADSVLLNLRGNSMLKIKVQLDGLPKDVQERLDKQMSERRSGFSGGMGGGPRGGGMRGGGREGGMQPEGGRRPAGMSDRFNRFEEKTLELKIKLANQKA